jgi:hypothetical protein
VRNGRRAVMVVGLTSERGGVVVGSQSVEQTEDEEIERRDQDAERERGVRMWDQECPGSC